MIHSHQKIDLLDKKVFERVKFTPPLKAVEFMDNEACLIYSRQGSSKMYTPYTAAELSTEDSILMKCGNFINHWQVSGENDEYEAVAIHFYPDILKLVFENHIPDYLAKPLGDGKRIFHKIERNAILKSYMDGLMVYFDNPSLFNADTAKLKLKELIGLLYRMNSHGIREILGDLFNPYQLSFKKVISDHLFNDLALSDLATLLHLSESTFKRKFKEIYDCAPGQYIQQKRLEKAAQLLATSSERITDVCYACGFSDVSNFSKAFSKRYHQSPSEYQSAHLN